MTKQEQFLWIVQTVILANAVNLATKPDVTPETKAIFSATGTLGTTDDAIWASGRIPESMSAYEAAHEFCGFILSNLRKPGEECPYWFARS